jgi:bifunctional DNase/RNase
MTALRIAHIEPWPGKRGSRGGFRINSFLIVLADEAGGRAIPLWLIGPEGHGLFRGDGRLPHPVPAEELTAELLRTAGVTVTEVDIDELDPALTTGPRRGREAPRASARIAFTPAGTAEPREMTARLGYALALAHATGAPIRVPDELMNRLAVTAEADPVTQFTRDLPVPRHRRRLPWLFRGRTASRLALAAPARDRSR